MPTKQKTFESHASQARVIDQVQVRGCQVEALQAGEVCHVPRPPGLAAVSPGTFRVWPGCNSAPIPRLIPRIPRPFRVFRAIPRRGRTRGIGHSSELSNQISRVSLQAKAGRKSGPKSGFCRVKSGFCRVGRAAGQPPGGPPGRSRPGRSGRRAAPGFWV